MAQNGDTVEIDRETLSQLRHFADQCVAEYGGIEVYNAILDAGIVLELSDPTPSVPPERMDLEGLRTWSSCGAGDIERYLDRYNGYAESN